MGAAALLLHFPQVSCSAIPLSKVIAEGDADDGPPENAYRSEVEQGRSQYSDTTAIILLDIRSKLQRMAI